MVDQPIDRGGGRHLIAKNPLPLSEDEIAREDHRSALVACGQDLVGAQIRGPPRDFNGCVLECLTGGTSR